MAKGVGTAGVGAGGVRMGNAGLWGAVAACVVSLSPVVALAQSGQPQAWTCTASGLKASEYKGGSSAYIHLVGYDTGGYYAVEKKGNVATGVTANGTKFTCRAK